MSNNYYRQLGPLHLKTFEMAKGTKERWRCQESFYTAIIPTLSTESLEASHYKGTEGGGCHGAL